MVNITFLDVFQLITQEVHGLLMLKLTINMILEYQTLLNLIIIVEILIHIFFEIVIHLAIKIICVVSYLLMHLEIHLKFAVKCQLTQIIWC